jgi:hypothetical protein
MLKILAVASAAALAGGAVGSAITLTVTTHVEVTNPTNAAAEAARREFFTPPKQPLPVTGRSY